ncbi:MAG: hypothetical protein A4S12_07635 [Proteobacteria bacterium SG_bin5]|nr:MAG: hypothetical protein A4S12_07635 [Proteobacteria bacterium SG_bin5]
MLRQSQIERDLAASQQRVVGNSMTAERGIADEAFASDVAGRFINAGVDTAITGAPIRTIGDVIARYAKDRAKLGLGRAAQRRADELAPILFDTDIGRTLGTVYDVMARRQAYDTAARRFNRIGGASASPLVLAYAQGE